jgi:acetyl esterase/lipase
VWRVTLVACTVFFLQACAPAYWLGMKLYYDKVEIPPGRVTMNIGYDATAANDHKRQLDFYSPEGGQWATVIFLHGGGWAWGDRSQTFGGSDVYANIGRFLAHQGFGAAVPSYRLIWQTDWRTQVSDVARAVAWVQHNTAERGGDPHRVFLMGHSAGAQLALRVAADPRWLTEVGGQPADICGVIAVSGAGYDLDDPVTERFDGDKTYYVQRFGGSVTEVPGKPETTAWRREASTLPLLDASDPPVLTMIATGDYPSVHHQSRLLDERLRTLGLSEGFVIVPRVNHLRIVLELSRADHVAGPAILKFLRETTCPRR